MIVDKSIEFQVIYLSQKSLATKLDFGTRFVGFYNEMNPSHYILPLYILPIDCHKSFYFLGQTRVGFLFYPHLLLSHYKIFLLSCMVYFFRLEVTMISIINALFNGYKQAQLWSHLDHLCQISSHVGEIWISPLSYPMVRVFHLLERS